MRDPFEPASAGLFIALSDIARYCRNVFGFPAHVNVSALPNGWRGVFWVNEFKSTVSETANLAYGVFYARRAVSYRDLAA